MKKTALKAVITAIVIITVSACFAITASAAGASARASRSTAKPGDSITVNCTYTADFELFAFSGTLSYDPSVVSYVSGAESNTGNAVHVYPTLSGDSRTYSFSVVFTAGAAGNAVFGFTGEGSDGISRAVLSDSCTITVSENQGGSGNTPPAVQPVPSDDASLVSLRVSGADLVPSFGRNTTNYTATVKYDVDKTTVSASAAAGASVVGAGTISLNVGNNNRTITVTAANGTTKKSYNINIRRMTKEETEAYEKSENKDDPLSVTVSGVSLTVMPDITALGIYNGYTLEKTVRGATEVNYLKDVNGKYKLYYLTDKDGNGRYYNQTANGDFEEITYIRSGLRLYIIKPIPANVSMGQIYEEKPLKAEGMTLPAWRFKQKAAQDIYILYGYYNGEMGYYRYDSLEKTVSRAPEFALANYASAEVQHDTGSGVLARFKAMDTQGKTVFILLALAALTLLVIIVLIIVKIARPRAKSKANTGKDETPSAAITEIEEARVIVEDTAKAQPPQAEEETDDF